MKTCMGMIVFLLLFKDKDEIRVYINMIIFQYMVTRSNEYYLRETHFNRLKETNKELNWKNQRKGYFADIMAE